MARKFGAGNPAIVNELVRILTWDLAALAEHGVNQTNRSESRLQDGQCGRWRFSAIGLFSVGR